MNRMHSSNIILVRVCIVLLLTSSVHNLVFAEISEQLIPKNSHSKSYGSGWECNHGYQQNGKICDVINVPENAYLKHTSFGDSWKCNWGYFKTDDNSCVAIIIPANAYLDSYGIHWQCKRGFKSFNNTCVAVKIPENGYFINSTFGKGWECERGFVANKNTCVTLSVPLNAHIDYSGHGWECNPPYTKQTGNCELLLKSNY